MASLAELVVTLTADASAFNAALASAGSAVNTTVKAAQAGFADIKAAGDTVTGTGQSVSDALGQAATGAHTLDQAATQASTALGSLANEEGQAGTAAQSLSGALGSAGTAAASTGQSLTDLGTTTKATSQSLQDLADQAAKSFAGMAAVASQLTSAGTALTAGLTAPIIGIGTAATETAGNFEHAMNRISAFGEITGKDLETLRAQALQLGADTQFSAQQAADGMAVLAQAGFNASQIFQSMPGILNLAAAGEISVAEAAKEAKDLIGQFGLAAKDSGTVADVLSKAAVLASGSLQDMAMSLSYAGVPAKGLGMTIQQTSAALIELDNAGLRGERAGTGLRGVLERLVGPSKQAADLMAQLGIAVADSSGKFLPLSNIVDQFKSKLPELGGQVQQNAALIKIFGVEHANAAQILINQGAPALDAYVKQLNNANGAADTIAKTINSGLSGALERARGSIETASIALGTLMIPAVSAAAAMVEKAANAMIPWVESFKTLPSSVQTGIGVLVGLAAAIGPVTLGAGLMITAIEKVGTAVLFFQSASLLPTIGTLGTFATVTIPAAVASLTTFNLTLLEGAIASLTEFGTVVIPATIATVETLGLTVIPNLITAFSTLTLEGIVAASTSFAAFATSAIAAVDTALLNLAMVAIPAATTALGLMTTAAGVAAAAFVGWKLGEWAYNNIPAVKALGDAIGDLILKIPGAEAAVLRLTGAGAQLDASSKSLADTTSMLAAKLAAHGIIVDKTGLSTDQYNDKLRAAIAAHQDILAPVKANSDAHAALTDTVNTSSDKIKLLQQAVADLTKRHAEGTASSADLQRAQDALNKEMDKVNKSLVAQDKANAAAEKSAQKLHDQIEKGQEKYVKLQNALLKYKESQEAAEQAEAKHGMQMDALDRTIQDSIAKHELIAATAQASALTMSTAIKGVQNDYTDFQDALATLGIKSADGINESAAIMKDAYERVLNSGVATVNELDQAWVAYEKQRQAAAVANGDSVTAAEKQALKDREDALSGSLKVQATNWDTFESDVQKSIEQTSKSLVKSLFEDPGSFGDKALKALEDLGAAVVSSFLKPVEDAVAKLITGALSDLLGGKGFGGILDSIKSIGSAIGSVFGAGADVASTAAGTASGAAGAAGSVASSAAGAGGQAASAASSGLSSIVGIVGAIGSVVSGISGVIGNFQNAQQESTLNAIEESTRYTKIWTGEQDYSIRQNTAYAREYLSYVVDDLRGSGNIKDTLYDVKANTYWAQQKFDHWDSFLERYLSAIASSTGYTIAKLDAWNDWLHDGVTETWTRLGDIRDTLKAIEPNISGIKDAVQALKSSGAGGNTITINLTGSASKSDADAVVAALRAQGAFA